MITSECNVHRSIYLAHNTDGIATDASSYVEQDVKDWVEKTKGLASGFFVQLSSVRLSEQSSLGGSKITYDQTIEPSELGNWLKICIPTFVKKGDSFGLALTIKPVKVLGGPIPTFRAEIACLLGDKVEGGYTGIKNHFKALEEKTYRNHLRDYIPNF